MMVTQRVKVTCPGQDGRNTGITLVEVTVAVAILVFTLLGLLQTFIYVGSLAEIAGNKTSAVNEAQTKLEEIRATPFTQIIANFSSGGTPGNTFTFNLDHNSTQPDDAAGSIMIDATNPDLLELEVVVSWQNQNGRLIGEDADLDGILDAGEDVNSNGKLDSPVRLMTYIANI